MVVGTLLDNVVLFGASHSEVKRLVLLIFVVVGVVLVSVDVLRGHVVVSGVLVVVRSEDVVVLGVVTLVVNISGLVGGLSLVMSSGDVKGLDFLVRSLNVMLNDLLVVGNCTLVASDVMGFFVVNLSLHVVGARSVNVSHRGVVLGLGMSNMRVLSVVDLGYHSLVSWLMVRGDGSMLHNGD